MADRSFLDWPFFDDRHRALAESVDAWAATSLSAIDHCDTDAACRSLGVAPRLIEASLQSYPGLPHRSQLLGVRDGVSYVNDSKATNADSAAKALMAFRRVRWIAGGLGKEGGIRSLKDQLSHVAKAYLIGHSAEDFALELGATPYEICRTMAEAVTRAAPS